MDQSEISPTVKTGLPLSFAQKSGNIRDKEVYFYLNSCGSEFPGVEGKKTEQKVICEV